MTLPFRETQHFIDYIDRIANTLQVSNEDEFIEDLKIVECASGEDKYSEKVGSDDIHNSGSRDSQMPGIHWWYWDPTLIDYALPNYLSLMNQRLTQKDEPMQSDRKPFRDENKAKLLCQVNLKSSKGNFSTDIMDSVIGSPINRAYLTNKNDITEKTNIKTNQNIRRTVNNVSQNLINGNKSVNGISFRVDKDPIKYTIPINGNYEGIDITSSDQINIPAISKQFLEKEKNLSALNRNLSKDRDVTGSLNSDKKVSKEDINWKLNNVINESVLKTNRMNIFEKYGVTVSSSVNKFVSEAIQKVIKNQIENAIHMKRKRNDWDSLKNRRLWGPDTKSLITNEELEAKSLYREKLEDLTVSLSLEVQREHNEKKCRKDSNSSINKQVCAIIINYQYSIKKETNEEMYNEKCCCDHSNLYELSEIHLKGNLEMNRLVVRTNERVETSSPYIRLGKKNDNKLAKDKRFIITEEDIKAVPSKIRTYSF